MHIAEGVLSAPVLISSAAITVSGCIPGLRKLDYNNMPRVAVFSSAFFVASLIHVPLGPTSVHLLLNGLTGVILGWASFPALLVALFLQAVLFQFGGITTLGVNTLNMALPAVIVFYLFSPLLKKKSKVLVFIGGFSAGFVAIFLSSLLVALSLFFTGKVFLNAARFIFLTHIPVMFIEGVITGFIVVFLRKVKPALLEGIVK